MFKKTLFFLLLSLLGLSMSLPLSNAKDFDIKEYIFIWQVVKKGNVDLKIRKDQDGLVVVLSSPGWKVATVSLKPSQAKAIGEVLAKTEDYYNKFKNSDDVEHFETVIAGGVFVTYSSQRKAKDFDIKVHKSKFVGATVLLTKDEALQISQYLRDSENMAAYVEKRIIP